MEFCWSAAVGTLTWLVYRVGKVQQCVACFTLSCAGSCSGSERERLTSDARFTQEVARVASLRRLVEGNYT